jgi:hypothetical protein
MKTRVKNLKELLGGTFQEGVNRVRRSKRGYGDEHTGDDYHDVSEELELEDFVTEEEECEEEGVNRAKRSRERGHDEGPAMGDDDYDVFEALGLDEDDQEIEDKLDDMEDVEEAGPPPLPGAKPPTPTGAQKTLSRGAQQVATGKLGSGMGSRIGAAFQAVQDMLPTPVQRRSFYQKMTTDPQWKATMMGKESPGSQPLGPGKSMQLDPASGKEDPRTWQLDHKMPKLGRVVKESDKSKKKRKG